MPWVMKRYHTPDGRLIIKEEKVKRFEYFEAHRIDGRLMLNLVPLNDDVSDSDGDDDEDETDGCDQGKVDQTAVENGSALMNGGIKCSSLYENINQGGGESRRNAEDLMRQKQSIQSVLAKQSDQQKLEYQTRLEVAIDVIRYLLNQGLSFRGHREDESSFNKGNYIKLLRWYTKRCDNIADAFKKAPKNNQLTSPYIQRDIITACKMETIRYIIKDLNDDYCSILVDESRDVSCKEQRAIFLRYVDRRGSVMERFIGIVHVRDTSALSLRNEIVGLLAQHSLSPSYMRGQCYDGASNMQGDLNGLKILIQKESKGAHSIQCFAHQLKLTLVAISRRCDEVQELLSLVSDILNMVRASFKRRDELRESQAKEIEEALCKGELETGRGLNQELGLARAGDTRWGSHYKSFKKIILMFGPIIDVHDAIAVNARFEEKCRAKGYLKACLTFEVVFMLHFMRTVLAITNELNAVFQKKEQDIANAMLLVEMAKERLQKLREEGWDSLIDELENYIVDVRDHDKRFSDLKGLCDFAKKLVETKKHGTYSLVFRLVKFVLLLPVATATVERAFSAMKLIKTDLRNRMDDELLSDCLVSYIEKEVFSTISNEDIMDTFQKMKSRRGEL
ncbi:uncharacterized protein LOC132628978 [Lycium barbarum]|uniref:uncharacterized protein LOC132628978 n=1 Tax=Lycium barbarum TaxID=112863 RepID=UPI00293F1E28|nr:uncharacterized protein LOC132628978 [Lycium barbarum]